MVSTCKKKWIFPKVNEIVFLSFMSLNTVGLTLTFQLTCSSLLKPHMHWELLIYLLCPYDLYQKVIPKGVPMFRNIGNICIMWFINIVIKLPLKYKTVVMQNCLSKMNEITALIFPLFLRNDQLIIIWGNTQWKQVDRLLKNKQKHKHTNTQTQQKPPKHFSKYTLIYDVHNLFVKYACSPVSVICPDFYCFWHWKFYN